MDNRFIKVQMIVAIPDYGGKHALCARDYITDDRFDEAIILDWDETEMKVVDA